MSKDSLSDYSQTAGSNTDVGGVNINEGCPSSTINNAIREVMSHIADWFATPVLANGLSLTGGFLGVGAGTTLTVSSGAVTATGSAHTIDTEASASTDDLDTISGGANGDLLILRTAANGRDIVLKDGTGNLDLGSDITLNDITDRAILIRTASGWVRFTNADN